MSSSLNVRNMKLYRLGLAALVAYNTDDFDGVRTLMRELWNECDDLDDFARVMLAVPFILFEHADATEQATSAARDLIATLALHEESN